MSMYQEALERIDYSLELINSMTSEQRRSLGAVSYVIEANLDYIKEVLPKIASKETPMKPTRQVEVDFGLGNVGDCICGAEVNYQQRYCNKCGQSLDWSNNNE